MKFSFKRIFGILTMFAFITATSYEPLCAAEIINCITCEEQGHASQSEDDCKTCEQSKEVASAVSLNKAGSNHDVADVPYIIADETAFASPEFSSNKPQAPPAVPVIAFTESIISITPIRGPSISA